VQQEVIREQALHASRALRLIGFPVGVERV